MADSSIPECDIFLSKFDISPWSNAAERELNEIKKGSGREMIKLDAHKRLWDDCSVFDS